MKLLITGTPKPQAFSFSLKSAQETVGNMTYVVESTKASRPITIFPSSSLPCRGLSRAAKELQGYVEKRSCKYEVPNCIMNKSAASLYEAIVVYTVFSETLECDRLKIFEAIDDLSAGHGPAFQMSNLTSTNLIEWTSRKLNLDQVHATLVLGDMLRIKPENVFCRFPQKNAGYSSQAQRDLRCLPRVLHEGDVSFKLRQTYPLRAMDGRTQQVACLYTDGGSNFSVYANAEMRFGVEELPAVLPASDIIATSGDPEIHLCPCSDIFWRYLALAQEGKLAAREGIVVTGCLGGSDEMTSVNLHGVLFHKVIIVCPKERPEFKNIDALAKRCISCGASSVCIFSQPIYFEHEDDVSSISHESQCEVDFTSRPINFSCVENVSVIAQYINRNAATYVQTSFSKSDEAQKKCTSGSIEDFCLLSIDDLGRIASSQITADNVTLRDLFTPSMRTMVFGDSNVGKSFFMQQISLAISTGATCFNFTISAPAKVVYLDGEMGDTFITRLNQLRGTDRSHSLENLKMMPLRNESLVDTQAQEQVLIELRKYKPHILIVDNIFALFNEAVRGNVDCLMDFVRNAEQLGIAVVLVHHTGKTGDTYKGPSEFKALCQNVIHLHGRDQITAKFDRERISMPQRLRVLINSEDIGPVISMTFEKCKICPELEKRESFYYLPVNGLWKPIVIDGAAPFLGAAMPCVTGLTDNVITEVAAACASENNVDSRGNELRDNDHDDTSHEELSEYELKIVKIGKHKRITNKSVRALLEYSKSTASSVLSGLVAKNILAQMGKGRNTHYVLVNANAH